MQISKESILQFLSDWPRRTRGFGTPKTVAGRITFIETEVIGGYCEALELPCPRGISSSLPAEETTILYPPTAPDIAVIVYHLFVILLLSLSLQLIVL